MQKSELCGLSGNNHVILQTPRYPHSGCGVSECSHLGSASPGAVCSLSVRREVQAHLALLFLLAFKLPIKL